MLLKKTTPMKFAWYSSMMLSGVFIVTSSLIWIFLVLTNIHGPEHNFGFLFGILDFIVSILWGYFLFGHIWREGAKLYNIGIIARKDKEWLPFSRMILVRLMFGVYWRSVIIGLVMGFLPNNFSKIILMLLDFFLAFLWLYTAPMGKYRIVFNVETPSTI